MATGTTILPAPEGKPSKTLDPAGPPSTNPDLAVGSTVDSSAGGGPKKDTKAKEVTAAAATPVSDTEKKIRRAERFGIAVQLSEQEKRNSRAERFGTTSSPHGSETLKQSEELKRKARAERFGIPVPTDEEAKKKARLERFAPVSKTDALEEDEGKANTLEEDKRKARAIRFSQDSESIELKAAIAGKADGGS